MATIPSLYTSGKIARDLNVPLHRVVRILSTRSDILPSAYAGRTRLYDAQSVARVGQELAAIDARRVSGVSHV